MNMKQLWVAGNLKERQPSRKLKLFISCILFLYLLHGKVFKFGPAVRSDLGRLGLVPSEGQSGPGANCKPKSPIYF